MDSAKYLIRLHWFLKTIIVISFLAGCYLVVGFLIPQLLPQKIVSSTTRAGIIFRNEHWKGEVKITGDLWSLPGAAVTVEPGTEIIINERGDLFNLHWLPWQLRSGLNSSAERFGVANGELFWDEQEKISVIFSRLDAVGTEQQPIIIRSSNPHSESRFDLNLIAINEGVLNFVKAGHYRRLEVGDRVTISNSQFDQTVECAVCIRSGSPVIMNNVFSKAYRQDIWISGGSPRIENNLFTDDSPIGILVDSRYGYSVIKHNNFEMPGKTALVFQYSGENNEGSVTANDFAGSSWVVFPCNSQVSFAENKVRGVIKITSNGRCPSDYVLGPNYWMSCDKNAVLREKVINESPNVKILIPSLMTSCPADVGRIEK